VDGERLNESSYPAGRFPAAARRGLLGMPLTCQARFGSQPYDRAARRMIPQLDITLPYPALAAEVRLFGPLNLLMRDPKFLIAAVRQKLQSIDPTLPQFEIATADDRLAEQDTPRRFLTELIGIFAGIALVLAATGLYGLMAYSVERRTREIGIRFALGATQAAVARMVLYEGLAWGAGGITVGVVGAVALGRALSASLYPVTATDPLTLFAVIALLALVMLTALVLPTHRASKIDPTGALRHE
jgi:predicted lysophospholipase L1 biosynthesis ABC-type transport system permease subunit